MLGPNYERPTVDAPAAFRFEPKEVADTANTAWWRQFNDPVLDQLIDAALANNLNVKVAAANVEQAAGVFTQTRSGLFPQIGYAGTGERARTTESGATRLPDLVPNPQTAYQAVLTASWEIDLWGRIRRLSESARANLLATDEGRRGVILTLVSSVATNYLTLRGLDEQLAISNRTLDTYAQSVRLYKLQFQYGQTSQMTVSQAQSQYETAAVQIPQIESQIAQTENALSVLLGRNPGPIPRGKSIYDLALPSVPSGVPSTLLERRPDLLQAEQTLIAANAQIGAAKALYFPTISLTGAFGGASAELSNLFTGPARAWNFTGQVVGPIFTFGAGERPGGAGRSRPAGSALQLPVFDPERIRRRRQCARRQPEAQGSARGAGAPGRRRSRTMRVWRSCNTTAATRATRPSCKPSRRCSPPSSSWPRCARRSSHRRRTRTRRWAEAGSPQPTASRPAARACPSNRGSRSSRCSEIHWPGATAAFVLAFPPARMAP